MGRGKNAVFFFADKKHYLRLCPSINLYIGLSLHLLVHDWVDKCKNAHFWCCRNDCLCVSEHGVKEGMEGDNMPLPTCPPRYFFPVSIVIIWNDRLSNGWRKLRLKLFFAIMGDQSLWNRSSKMKPRPLPNCVVSFTAESRNVCVI